MDAAAIQAERAQNRVQLRTALLALSKAKSERLVAERAAARKIVADKTKEIKAEARKRTRMLRSITQWTTSDLQQLISSVENVAAADP